MASSLLHTTTIKLPFVKNHNTTSTHQISTTNNTQNLEIKLQRRHFMLGGLGVSSYYMSSASANANEFPATLDKTITTTIRRPKISRTKKEKLSQEELLVIEGIELDQEMFVKFDVLINDDQMMRTRPYNTEFAGSFVNVPRISLNSERKKKMKTSLRLGLTDLLEDLDADGDEEVAVTLVPRHGADAVVIGSVKIEFEH